ncbi:MAG: hypothetical protein ABH845_00555 [Candidatus Omnitrophota bacterium]
MSDLEEGKILAELVAKLLVVLCFFIGYGILYQSMTNEKEHLTRLAQAHYESIVGIDGNTAH